MQAREAVPRSEEPTVTISQRKDKRWHVYVRLPDGRSCNSTCKTQKDAKDRAEDFLAGLDVKLPGAATGAAAACRKSSRGHTEPAPAPKRVSPNYVAGPGRGHKDRVTRATLAFTALKKQLVLDFAENIMNTDVREMDELYMKALDTIYSGRLVADKVLFDASQTVILRHRRDSSVTAFSKRTAQRHKAVVLHTLSEIAGENVERKIELASEVLATLQQGSVQLQNRQAEARAKQNEDKAHKFIVLGLRHALSMLKHRNSGRFTHDDRVAQQSLLSAASCKLPINSIAAAARLLDTSERGISRAVSRWNEYEAGERDAVFDQTEAASHLYAHADFVAQQWLEHTRESERMTDELKNPKDRSDPQLYRVHFQEDRTEDILDRIFETGVQKFGVHGPQGFHLSMTTLLKYKPFQIRRARAETCVCVHHLNLKWAKMVQVYRKQRQELKVSRDKCKCDLKIHPDEARQAVSCEKPPGQDTLSFSCVHRTCPDCPGFKPLEMCEQELKAAENVTFQREKWGKGTYQRADGSTKEYYDFFVQPSDFEDLTKEMKAYIPTIVAHHDLAKVQDLD